MSNDAKKSTPVPMRVEIITSGNTSRPVTKADAPTQLSRSEENCAYEWIEPPTDLRGYKALVNNSTILPQCIRAYKQNICGFGLGVRYKEDVEQSAEIDEEFNKALQKVEQLTLEQDTKELFENVIESRETYGIAYVEVIRSIDGEVVQIDFIEDTPSIRKTIPLMPYVPSVFYVNGEEIERNKKYRKYSQQIGGKTIYFKEFGDPRIMDLRNGSYVDSSEGLDRQYQANEIIEFAIGTEPYGEVRWIGQVLGVTGSRKAENLNLNYFENGRHIPLMMILKGGTLSDESMTKLRQYMDGIKGENGQHAFLLLEEESKDGITEYESTDKPDIEIKELANILQKDELFQDYMENTRKKVQSAFQLPDIYVGYTTDFNRATSLTARQVTEEQVFQPERKSLAWAVNNKLLSCYHFKNVEVYFKEPDITSPDDLFKILSVCRSAGGITPNFAKEIAYNAYGRVSEDYEDDWGNIPIGVNTAPQEASQAAMQGITASLEQQMRKAAKNHDDEVVAIMREIRKMLKSKQEE